MAFVRTRSEKELAKRERQTGAKKERQTGAKRGFNKDGMADQECTGRYYKEKNIRETFMKTQKVVDKSGIKGKD